MFNFPIVDGHIDIAWNYTSLNRKFEDSAEIKQTLESSDISNYEGIVSVGFPEIKAANIRVVLSTIWVETFESVYPSRKEVSFN